MKIDVLVAEIGSTTTLVNAFNIKEKVVFLGRGFSKTTINDVNLGLTEAIDNLKVNLGAKDIEYQELFASSSAAGGLKITVHGLVYEMTSKAAKEAALNAGANLYLVTAGDLEEEDLKNIKEINPNIIIIAGGTNYGEKETSYHNLLKVVPLKIPIIYAGNISNQQRINNLNNENIKIVDNVYPRVDDFNILPLRKAIYDVFGNHIIHAKGMSEIVKKINGRIIPTPGAVMDATLLLNELIKGVLTIDIGGATTDIHSVSEPKPIYQKYLEGEPFSKRTVEGDLGVFVNRNFVYQTFKHDYLESKLNLSKETILKLIQEEPFIPKTIEGKKVIDELTIRCLELGLNRHVGDLKRVYTTNGLKVIPEGKDLSQVKVVTLTGGALLNLENAQEYVLNYFKSSPTKLVPNEGVLVLKDEDYLFSSIGVLAQKYPNEAKELLKKTLRWEG